MGDLVGGMTWLNQ